MPLWPYTFRGEWGGVRITNSKLGAFSHCANFTNFLDNFPNWSFHPPGLYLYKIPAPNTGFAGWR